MGGRDLDRCGPERATTLSLAYAITHPAVPRTRHELSIPPASVGTTTTQAITIDTTAPAAAPAITSIAGSSSPNDRYHYHLRLDGALVNADKVQISGDGGVTWTDVVQTTPTNWTFADNVTRIANFNYRTRIIDIAGNVGVTITQPVLVANNGGTISVVGPHRLSSPSLQEQRAARFSWGRLQVLPAPSTRYRSQAD